MKFIVITGSLLLGLILGLATPPDKRKPLWFIIVLFAVMTGAICLNFLPPLAAGPEAAVKYAPPGAPPLNILIKPTAEPEAGSNFLDCGITVDISDAGKESHFKKDIFYVIKANYDTTRRILVWKETVAERPLMTFPYVPQLGERVRILNLHVPVAWIAVLAYMIAMVYSIMYLKTKKYRNELLASSSAAIGFIFTLLATVTGMFWAKANWGSFWNWDPRETSIFILLLIYGAYFGLRSSIGNEVSRARLSSVYLIFAFIAVPFLVFVLPRISAGLHPGSLGDGSGPVLSQGEGMLDSMMLFAFGLSMTAFTLLYFMMLNLLTRLRKMEIKL